jgi:hypothetical protein
MKKVLVGALLSLTHFIKLVWWDNLINKLRGHKIDTQPIHLGEYIINFRSNYKLHPLTLVKVQFSFKWVNSVLQLAIGFNSVFPFDSVSLPLSIVNFYFLFSLIKKSRKLIKTQKNQQDHYEQEYLNSTKTQQQEEKT